MSHHKQVHLAGSVLERSRHICAFFHSKDEEYRVLLPFIKEGFEQGDRAFHFIDAHRRQDHMRRLQQAGIDVDGTGGEERLVVRHWEDGYLQEGYFDQHRQISLFERVLLEGKTQGYPLTRFVASMEWALLDRPGVRDLIEYECRLNNMFSKYEDPVCCTYDVCKFSASVILDAMRVHPAVIIGGVYQENPFYVPPDEFLRELRERAGEEKEHGCGSKVP
ncbi:MAG: sensory transduction histidine kinase [Phycisphaerales bacterium]|nr:sensory transduction histidine kinase [Phycisphaerales bacterium]